MLFTETFVNEQWEPVVINQIKDSASNSLIINPLNI